MVSQLGAAQSEPAEEMAEVPARDQEGGLAEAELGVAQDLGAELAEAEPGVAQDLEAELAAAELVAGARPSRGSYTIPSYDSRQRWRTLSAVARICSGGMIAWS
jgi:hypothetical protein